VCPPLVPDVRKQRTVTSQVAGDRADEMAGPALPAEVGVVAGTPKRPGRGPLADGEDEGVPDRSLQLAVAILCLVSALCLGLGCGHCVPFSVQRRWAEFSW